MIDRKNLILVIVVLIGASIVGFYIPYLQYQERQRVNLLTATSTPNGAHETILYTNKGFEPNTLTVKLGTTVEWNNVSERLMWVASDPHPAHTDLHGFDERGVDGQNEQTSWNFTPTAYAHTGGSPYSYTFTKVGRWSYHNHLNPADRGVVVVEPF